MHNLKVLRMRYFKVKVVFSVHTTRNKPVCPNGGKCFGIKCIFIKLWFWLFMGQGSFDLFRTRIVFLVNQNVRYTKPEVFFNQGWTTKNNINIKSNLILWFVAFLALVLKPFQAVKVLKLILNCKPWDLPSYEIQFSTHRSVCKFSATLRPSIEIQTSLRSLSWLLFLFSHGVYKKEALLLTQLFGTLVKSIWFLNQA